MTISRYKNAAMVRAYNGEDVRALRLSLGSARAWSMDRSRYSVQYRAWLMAFFVSHADLGEFHSVGHDSESTQNLVGFELLEKVVTHHLMAEWYGLNFGTLEREGWSCVIMTSSAVLSKSRAPLELSRRPACGMPENDENFLLRQAHGNRWLRGRHNTFALVTSWDP